MTFHPYVHRGPRTFPWKCWVRSSSCSDVVYRNVSRCFPGHSSRYAQNPSYSTTGHPKLCWSGVQPDRGFSFTQVREIDCSEPGQTGSKFIPSGYWMVLRRVPLPQAQPHLEPSLSISRGFFLPLSFQRKRRRTLMYTQRVCALPPGRNLYRLLIVSCFCFCVYSSLPAYQLPHSAVQQEPRGTG